MSTPPRCSSKVDEPSCERGQTTAEYVGLIVVVGLILAALAGFAGDLIAPSLRCALGGSCSTAYEPAGPELDIDALLAGDPDAISERMEELSDEQVERLVEDHADVLAGITGVPLCIRDAANHVRLAREAEWLRDAAESPELSEEERMLLRQRSARFDEWADSDRAFVMFDPRGDGQVAEVLGGPLEDAEHVAVIVPGTGNDIDTFDDHVLVNGTALQAEMDRVAVDDENAATVVCLCFDAPDTLSDATSQSYADGGAGAFRDLVDESLLLSDAQDVTVIGHSYGSTLVGQAQQDHGLATDRVVFMGSPGLGSDVNDVDDLGTDAEVWAVRAARDYVPFAPVLGEAPHDDGFGASHYSLGDIHGHSSYYRSRSRSLNNLARVASGQEPVGVEHERP